MRNNRITFQVVAILTLLAVLPLAYGAPTLNTPEEWTTSGDLKNWKSAVGSPPAGGASAVGVDNSMGGSPTPSAFHVTFAAQGSPAPEDEKIYADINFNSSGGIFFGNYTPPGEGNLVAGFAFYADDYTTPANTLAFFFASDTSGSTRTWKYALNGPATIDAWYNYSVPIAYSASWTSAGAGAAEFAADMLDVDQIGIWVYRASNIAAQNYGLDNFQITWAIPEPSTYVILAFTLLTLSLTLRRKQIFTFSPVRALIGR